MITIIDAKAILAVGTSMSASAIAAAWTILAITGPIAFAINLVRHSVGGRHPLFVVFQIVLVSFALRFYGNITGVIDNVGKTAAAQVNKAGNFQKLFESYQTDLDSAFKSEASADASEKTVGDMLSVVTSFGAGLLSGLLSVVGALAVIVALHIYQILQAVLYGVLVAVGPIVIAVSIVPGAQSLVSKWLSALFELAMWPVIGAVIFEMVGKALLQLHESSDKNFVTMFSANIVLVMCVFLVPRIAARLVGSGFGAIGDVMSGQAVGAATAPIASAGRQMMHKAANMAQSQASNAGEAIRGAVDSLSAPQLYQPPANGGPSIGMTTAPTMAEREDKPPAFHGNQTSKAGPESFDAHDAKQDGKPSAANNVPTSAQSGSAVAAHPVMEPSVFASVPAEKWQGLEVIGGAKHPPLAITMPPPKRSGERRAK